MSLLRRVVFVSLVVCPLVAFGQADQAIVSVADTPDPVVPGSTLTYTVTFRNDGPDPAVNGGVNLLFDGNFMPTSVVPPAGFSCGPLAQHMSCVIPSFTPGSPVVITVTGTVAPHLITFPDGTLSSFFTTSGVTPDPNPGNNSFVNVVTAYDSPQVDLSLTVTDSPDPVAADGTLTYVASLTNSGPATASNVSFNVAPHATLAFQSVTVSPGWSCVPPSVGAQNATFACSRASWAPGFSQFVVTFSANDENVGGSSTSLQSVFSVFAGGSDESDDGADNQATVITQYTAGTGPAEVPRDADLSISKSTSTTSALDNTSITFNIALTNNGPDSATDVVMQDVLLASLLFKSITPPPGWTCLTPAVGETGTITCSALILFDGDTANFTLVTTVNASSGTVTNTAVASHPGLDNDVGNSSSTTSPISLAAASDIPTLSQQALLALMAMLGVVAVLAIRR